jgi:crossover junction endodeoxyribonuclease RuvC
VLGVDPGANVTGFGVIDRSGVDLAHVAHGTIRVAREGSLPARLHRLHRAILEVIAQHEPHTACIEQVFVAANPRSALVLGQARGAVLAAVGSAGLPVHEYAATHIKQTVTGSGRAPKIQVQRVVARMLELERPPAADAADALAAAISHASAGRLSALGVVPGRGRTRRRGGRGLVVRRSP